MATVVLLSLGGCAGPNTSIPSVGSQEIAAEQSRQLANQLQSYISQTTRLHRVYHKIAVANAEFCGANVSSRLGLTAITATEVPVRFREASISLLNLDAQFPTVIAVVDDGPAGRAGIAVGDVLMTINGEAVPQVASSAGVDQRLARASQRARIEVRRKGKTYSYLINPVSACSYPISLAIDVQPNAFTDGRQIVIHTGVLRIAQSDAELATIVAHELAHITMAHIEKKQANQMAGTIGGLLIDVAFAAAGLNTQGAFTTGLGEVGAQAYGADFEREADYVGAHFVARAGYDASQAEKFWRALAQENPRQIFFAGIHPSTPERFLLMQRANEEIDLKRRRNLPLRPELKPAPMASTQVDSNRGDR